ncbi:unnamed protein product [Candidula unifasciata]|uniref:2-phosphoxylose phosphatase 1 n=1 Tax=Candidula unifasciata TaxID=100452 RepID=A0A8S3Z9N2_9EUPU|nr:unnamed protein product [Candidula unifasciata]
MYSFHLRHILNIKFLIVAGFVSLLVTFLLLMFSDDLHHNGKQSTHKKLLVPINKLKPAEDDTKMFHWMKDDEARMRVGDNASVKDSEEINKGHLLFQKDTRPPLTVARIAKYCNAPYSQELGNEGLVPEDYKLLGVHVVIRHGDRSPISRLPNTAVGGPSCLIDTSQHAHLPKVTNFISEMAASSQNTLKNTRFHRWALYPSHPKCADGQLTGRGALQHIIYGMHYSERYFQKHKLFHETNWHKEVIVHTTEVPRTFQSAIAFLYGLLPNFDLEKINLKSSSNINFCEESVFHSACSCAGLDMFRNKAVKECRLDAGYTEIMKKYEGAQSYIKIVLNLQTKDLPYAAALMDGLSSYACHNTQAPCNTQGKCITAKIVESIWESVDYQSICFHRNKNYKKYAQANTHGLLYRIAKSMNSAAFNGTVQKFHLYSGHDTTISPLITALELDDAVWPGYASRLTFELYQRQSTGEHFIRVLQNGKVVTSQVVFCRHKAEGDFCKFSYFYTYVSDLNLQEFCNSVKFTSMLTR